jgi:lipoate synthase
MKLIKTIQNLVEDAEKEYNKVLESTTNMKEIERAEKNYFDSLKVLKKFNELNGYKRP